nr:hypothetical protein Iba_chr04fCG3560 [Ipomoea batatas]
MKEKEQMMTSRTHLRALLSKPSVNISLISSLQTANNIKKELIADLQCSITQTPNTNIGSHYLQLITCKLQGRNLIRKKACRTVGRTNWSRKSVVSTVNRGVSGHEQSRDQQQRGRVGRQSRSIVNET